MNDPPRTDSIARNEVAIDYKGRLARYQAALDAGADPTVVASWIAQAQADRDAALRRTYRQQPAQTTTPVTADELNAILDQLGNLVDALRMAHPDHKHEVYRSLGLQLTYQPETQTVRARIDLGPHRWVFARVGGATRTKNQPHPQPHDQEAPGDHATGATADPIGHAPTAAASTVIHASRSGQAPRIPGEESGSTELPMPPRSEDQ
ncbi:MAG: hypothetical protein ACM30G_14830 [Micromonosporaceae bacterium]